MTSTELHSPTLREEADEALLLVDVVPFYGPPVAALAFPWLLLSLMLAGPFTLALTIVALLVAAAAVVGLIGAILASPYLLLRHLRGHRRPRAMPAPAPRLVMGASR